jgi:polyribonucleotide 5'-hydroxyl-kinase
VRLLSGTAEKDGTELALQHTYAFAGVRSRILSWHGCELEVTGKCEADAVVQFAQPADTPVVAYLNLHGELDARRKDAGGGGAAATGPRVLIAGGPSTGKSSLARCLAAWATRIGDQPLVVHVDPGTGMLALPGTVSAAVFATLVDIESADGWGAAPTSETGVVPAKSPLVYLYGQRAPEDDVEAYKQAVGRIATGVTARLSADPEVRRTGLIVDTPAVAADSEVGIDILAHVVEELSGKKGLLAAASQPPPLSS